MTNIATRTISLAVADTDHFKRLKDPVNRNVYHAELLVPFSQAVLLERGNANVRPHSERKVPFKRMTETVENEPSSFHLRNRGITYFCESFEWSNGKRTLSIEIPDVDEDEFELLEEEGVKKFGIADGGHTFAVIQASVKKFVELAEEEDWQEPWVRIHLMAGNHDDFSDADIVEALNTSTQVQQYTLDEYQNEFEDLKYALDSNDFDSSIVAFSENEEKDWNVVEIIQRLACFLRDRWTITQPTSIYKSKSKALKLFKTDREEFRKLYDVIVEVITFPEYIQSELSQGDLVDKKSLSQLKAVKRKKEPFVRAGTTYPSEHKVDFGALMPMAAAFRELLVLRGDRYKWRVDPKDVFKVCAPELYQVLVSRSRKLRSITALGSDQEFWNACVPIVLRAKDKILDPIEQ